MTEWADDMDIHDSVDDFLDAVGVPDPDGSIEASRAIQRAMALGSRPPAWYSSVEYPDWDAHLAKVQRRNFRIAAIRGAARWMWHPNVVLFVGLSVLLLLAVTAA